MPFHEARQRGSDPAMTRQTSVILAAAMLALVLLRGMAAWIRHSGGGAAGSAALAPPHPSVSDKSAAASELASPTDDVAPGDATRGERSDARPALAKVPPRDPSAEPDWNALVMTRLSGKSGPSSEPERWFERYVLLGLWRKRMREEPRGAYFANAIRLSVETWLDARGRFNDIEPGGSAA